MLSNAKLPVLETLIFTVTNNLCFDQRMTRICNSLSGAGYRITLVGTGDRHSPPLEERPYSQKRIFTVFHKGPGFYVEFNIRLLFYLIFKKADAICCIDLDTILPAWFACKMSNTKRIYDAHEYFSQQKEIISRRAIYKIWHWIEKTFIPKFTNGYTVSAGIAAEYKRIYRVQYEVIRNLPVLKTNTPKLPGKERFIIYQGAVNESRGLEFLVPAMKNIDAVLVIYGDGNFMDKLKKHIASNNLQEKVFYKGKLLPDQLEYITRNAYMGLNLVENTGLNQYYSLANKFFDYMQAGLPQLSMNFPEYKKINDEFEIAVLLDDCKEETIIKAANQLLNDEQLYARLQQNCLKAKEIYNWQNEEKKLIAFYNKIFHR